MSGCEREHSRILEYELNNKWNREKFYSTFLGQLFYFKSQEPSILRILISIENIFFIPFSAFWENSRKDLDIAVDILERLLQGDYEGLEFDIFWDYTFKTSGQERDFALSIVKGVIDNSRYLDKIIEKYSLNWSINRICTIDHNIMRMAVYELLFIEDVPHSVTANEAVEMAKNFGSKKSSQFINGILGKIIEEILSDNLTV